ncbi:MAG: VTT domain-containing protein [Candidatus Altiarchaeota archaeon]
MIWSELLPQLSPVFEEIVRSYGILGLAVSSFLGATVFIPLVTEFLFPILRAYDISSLTILLVASFSSVLGLYVNYRIGYQSVKYLSKKVKKKHGQKAKKIINEYGDVGLFIILVFPAFPADPLTVFAGAAEMDLQKYLIIGLLAKLIRYGTVLGVLNLFM